MCKRSQSYHFQSHHSLISTHVCRRDLDYANPDYVKICKPAFFSGNIPDGNILFDLLQGRLKSSERAEEYGERFWRLIGEHHTLICFDAGGCMILERVEECHHDSDDSILDELFAAASILTKAGLKRKQEFLERAGEEKLRKFISEHYGYFVDVFESEEASDEDVVRTIVNSPAPAICQLLHIVLKKENMLEKESNVIDRIIEALGEKRLLAVLDHDFKLRREILPIMLL